jgi:hypothetical protein
MAQVSVLQEQVYGEGVAGSQVQGEEQDGARRDVAHAEDGCQVMGIGLCSASAGYSAMSLAPATAFD